MKSIYSILKSHSKKKSSDIILSSQAIIKDYHNLRYFSKDLKLNIQKEDTTNDEKISVKSNMSLSQYLLNYTQINNNSMIN